MYPRLYAKVVGVTIVLIGVGGVLLGEQSLFGVVTTQLVQPAMAGIQGLPSCSMRRAANVDWPCLRAVDR